MTLNYSTTPDAAPTRPTADYLQGDWDDDRRRRHADPRSRRTKLITNALFGSTRLHAYGWRNHAGIVIDTQYFWWHASADATAPRSRRLRRPQLRPSQRPGRQRPPRPGPLGDRSGQAPQGPRRARQPGVRRAVLDHPDCSWTMWGIVHRPAAGPEQSGRDAACPTATASCSTAPAFPGQVWLDAGPDGQSVHAGSTRRMRSLRLQRTDPVRPASSSSSPVVSS